ncbi:MAG: ferrous iron transporter B [Clostridia bacterium]|nr:ferrous iron transporter B [Clostridia bacterium]
MRIALVGNPNSGKTTVFNALTGADEKVGNWTGVTVEKKEKYLKRSLAPKGERIVLADLPGAYSLTAFTAEEGVTREYVLEDAPDVIVNVVDATSLARSLFFTTQILQLGIPTVVALNKQDVNERQSVTLDTALLSKYLHCPVLATSATSGEGLKNVVQSALSLVGKGQKAPYQGSLSVTSEAEAFEADRARYQFINPIAEAVGARDDGEEHRHPAAEKLDALLTSSWVGIPVFALVMFLVFQISQVWVGAPIADWFVSCLEAFQEWVGSFLSGADPLLYALLIDGVLGGVIAVVGFLPLVMVLYFLIALLEDCGYMSRVAVVLDPIFKKVGLSGRSVIPFVISVGCAVPAVMASRTVKNERERRATVMLAPFIPCGAKIPVIALFAGAFFDGAGWVSAVMYLFGIVVIFLGALLVRRVTGAEFEKSYFILELPEYKAPSLWGAVKSMLARGRSYVVKASTVILLCNTAVQLMQSFTFTFAVAESANASILAQIAAPFAYVLVPIVGVLSWELAAAAITGFIAKENVVGTLAVCFAGLSNFIDTEELALLQGAGADVAGVMAITKVAALAYLMFNLFTPPCFAAIGAMRAEMKSTKWLLSALGLQFGIGFCTAYLVYTLGTLATSPAALNVTAALIGLGAVLFFAFVLVFLSARAKRRASVE